MSLIAVNNGKIRIGCHVPWNLEVIQAAKDLGMSAIQFCLGSPQGGTDYTVVANTYPAIVPPEVREGLVLIVHAPYWYNLVRGDELTEKSFKDMKRQLNIAHSLGARFLVTHLGYRGNKSHVGNNTYASAAAATRTAKAFIKMMEPYLFKYNIRLLLENGSGSNNGMKAGDLQMNVHIADESSHNVGLCLDTQHAWADGEDVNSPGFPAWIKRTCDVVHLNANPFHVEKGSHIDEHSEIPLEESTGYGEEFFETLINDYTGVVIFERETADLATQDFHWVKARLRNGP